MDAAELRETRILKDIVDAMDGPPTTGLRNWRDYSDEELEFLRAVDAYQTRNRRRFPALVEILAVLKSLGYEKVREAGPLPVFKIHPNGVKEGGSR